MNNNFLLPKIQSEISSYFYQLTIWSCKDKETVSKKCSLKPSLNSSGDMIHQFTL